MSADTRTMAGAATNDAPYRTGSRGGSRLHRRRDLRCFQRLEPVDHIGEQQHQRRDIGLRGRHFRGNQAQIIERHDVARMLAHDVTTAGVADAGLADAVATLPPAERELDRASGSSPPRRASRSRPCGTAWCHRSRTSRPAVSVAAPISVTSKSSSASASSGMSQGQMNRRGRGFFTPGGRTSSRVMAANSGCARAICAERFDPALFLLRPVPSATASRC